MVGDKPKWYFTFSLLLLTLGWAVFSVKVVQQAMTIPTQTSVIEASGVGVLLGALIGWNGNVIQFWFRKSTPDTPTTNSTTTTSGITEIK